MTVIEQRSERDQVAFPELSETQIAIIAGFAGKRTFAAGETLFAAGESDFKFYVVISGEVEIIDDSSCEYKTVVVHQAGEFTGDIDMLTGRPAVVSAIARTDCEVYEMSAVDLRKLLGEVPFIGDVLLRGFLMRRQLLLESGFVGVRVVGSRYCKDTHRIREFLSRNFVPFKWLDLENDPHVNEL
ncbi:MAG: Crp/Fnr family transcriptional regulator, partial [Candidatus Dadabacteria bacterium]